jgi:uncharacterized protein YbbC (DUF1343 family)
MMAACADANVPVIILDRPNPIGGLIVDGSVTEIGSESFMSLIPVPYIHGLTLGEIAVMMNEEGWLKSANGNIVHCDLSVIKMNDWTRDMQWNDCNLLWFPTSPQIPSPEAVMGAATLGIFGELSIFNIGIGTSLPFRYIGTPDMDETRIFKEIRKFANDNEVLIQIAHFKPFYGKFSQQNCRGFIFNYPYSTTCKPYLTGVKTILAIRKIQPKYFDLKQIPMDRQEMFRKVTGGSELLDLLFDGANDKEILDVAEKGVEHFLQVRMKYLMY